MVKICLSIFLILSLRLCTTGSLSPRDYRAFVTNPDNGLIKTKHIGDVDYIVTYKPHELIAVIENDAHIDSGLYAGTMGEISGLQYYNFKLKINDKTKDILKANVASVNDYYGRVEYFTSLMQDDIWLIQGTDTLPCRIFHYERNYSAAPYSDFSLAFDGAGNNVNTDRTIVFNDHVFNNGLIKLTISGSDIKKIPALKI